MRRSCTILISLLLGYSCITPVNGAPAFTSREEVHPPEEMMTELPPPATTMIANSYGADLHFEHQASKNYIHPFEPYTIFPHPFAMKNPVRTITLKDAILLALRFSPDVINPELDRVTQKYSVIEAQNQFEMQYTLSGGVSLQNNADKPVYNVTTTASIMTPVGTQAAVTYTNPLDGSPGNVNLTVTQPLIRGFGQVAEFAYLNALDNEEINRWGFKENIMSAVVNVITNYRGLVEDYNNLSIQKEQLLQNEITVRQDRLKVKAGQMAPSDLLQDEVTLETTRLSYIQEENSIQQSYQTFLESLGLIPTAELHIDTRIKIGKVYIPKKERCIALALHYNPGYQQSLIGLNAAQRAVVQDKNSLLPELNVVVSMSAGASGTGPEEVNTGQEPMAAFNFDIPIDDVSKKAQLLDDTIALEKDKISLEQLKENLIRNVITDLNNIVNQAQQVRISEKQVALQEHNYQSYLIMQRYGKTTTLAVSQVQTDLLQQKTSLVSTKITYLNDVTSLYKLMGLILDQWNIQLRY